MSNLQRYSIVQCHNESGSWQSVEKSDTGPYCEFDDVQRLLQTSNSTHCLSAQQSTPLKIGKYYISQSLNNPKNISIYKEDGEGGDFPNDVLAEAIRQFYNDNF